MSLQTGASLITLSLLLNKISGLYGLLALLTGYHLSPVQLSMYIYSLLALGLTALLFPHIRKQTPLQCLALAWLYVLDSLINAAYTAAFGVTWFLVVSQHYDNGSASGPGGETIAQTAGFTSPNPDGQGWQGKLGRIMISIGRNYWLGEDEEGGNWMATLGRRFRARAEDTELPGPLERERRRRSGTGPPQPSQSAFQAVALQQPIHEQAPGMNVKMNGWTESR
ncbi:UPF0596 Golgi apparatus membrane protein c [Aspergillus luchuensis]|uniref:UPF0596 Golgi apparatus membrane protein c n=1 Tax=Aspergillus kawachii TaxID=1069201 RepID=A0A146G027_ASPKA|nr:UPF0596 Golgi apparatus membrane protein c [Aspergillus luchuensis]